MGGLLTASVFRYDTHSQSAFSSGGFAEMDVIDLGDNYGNGAQLAALSALAWASGAASNNLYLRATGQRMMLGLAADATVVTSLKLLTRRRRPDGSDTRSFPSGHTSGAFTVSTILSRRYDWRIGMPAYALATMTALGRMEDHKHYASDVVAGAFLGIVIGRLVTAPVDQVPSRLQVVPAGIGAALRFSL